MRDYQEQNMIPDDAVVVYSSGWKDSTATILLALETYPKSRVIPVFNDTGWEHPATYEYLDYLQDRLQIEIRRTRGETVPDLIRKYGNFPFGMGRFCTSSTKVSAIYKWYKSQGFYRRGQAQSWIGIRADESNNRARKYGDLSDTELLDYSDLYPSCPKSLSNHVKVRLPILWWSTQQVFDYLKQHDVAPNPLYAEGTNDRVGCYPCLLAGKKAQEKMFATEVGQQRLEIIRQLEKDIGQKYQMYDTDQGSCEMCKL